MLQGVSNHPSAVLSQNNRIQQSRPVQKAVSEESKVNAEERNESASAERSETTNKIVGNNIDRFA